MYLLAIQGSPRRNGHTNYLLKIILEELKKSEIQCEELFVASKNIKPCISCYSCQKSDEYKCIVNDDFLECAELIRKSDILLFATPVYWFGVTGFLKAFIDRFFCLIKFDKTNNLIKSTLEGKKIALILTAGSDAFSGADLVVASFMRIANFCKLDYSGTLGAYCINNIEDIKNNKPLIEEAKIFADKLIGIV
jgi:multimeric flavodoxin WrbA